MTNLAVFSIKDDLAAKTDLYKLSRPIPKRPKYSGFKRLILSAWLIKISTTLSRVNFGLVASIKAMAELTIGAAMDVPDQ